MLTFDEIVMIDMDVNSSGLSSTVFDTGLFMSRSVPFSEAYKTFNSPMAMLSAGFSADLLEYKSALMYFSANPAPSQLMIARVEESAGFPQTLAQLLNQTSDFYGILLIGATEGEMMNFIPGLEAMDRFCLFCPVIGRFDDYTAPSGFLSRLSKTKSRRAVGVCLTAPEEAGAVLGLAMGLTRACANSAFSLCYKSHPLVQPVQLTEGEVATVKYMNGNAYVARGVRKMLEPGTTFSGARYDEVLYMDMIASDLQDACMSVLADSLTKLPQNDTTTAQFFNVISATLDKYVARGILGPAVWKGQNLFTLHTGDRIDNGYALFADSYDNQVTADRNAHKAMPIHVVLCFTGSVEFVKLVLQVQN